MEQSMLNEFMRRCERDPVYFVNSLLFRKTRGIVDGNKVRHLGQENFLRNSNEPINVLVPGNRFGKSTVIGMRHLHKAFTKKGLKGVRDQKDWMEADFNTISLAHASDQAAIVFKEARALATQSPAFAPFVKRVRETPFPHIVLWNNSVIHMRSAHDGGKYVDGHTYRHVSVDEAGWIQELKRLINEVLLMRMAGGGLLDLVGTPKGFGDLYYYAERGLRGVPGYYTQRGSIFENPFLSREDLEMREKLIANADPRLRAQVFDGDFVDFDGLAFSRDQRENLFLSTLPPHQDWVKGRRYVQAWDLGRRTDYTVGVTLDVTAIPWVMVDFQRLNRVPWEEIYRLIGQKAEEYHVSLPRIDATGPQGDVIEEELWKRGIHVDGFRITTGAIKTDLINTLQTCLDWNRELIDEVWTPDEGGVMHRTPIMEEPDSSTDAWGLLRAPPITQLVDEMGIYRLDDKDLVQDCVITLAMAADAAYQESMVGDPVSGGIYG